MMMMMRVVVVGRMGGCESRIRGEPELSRHLQFCSSFVPCALLSTGK